jgi:hypothetical protein
MPLDEILLGFLAKSCGFGFADKLQKFMVLASFNANEVIFFLYICQASFLFLSMISLY